LTYLLGNTVGRASDGTGNVSTVAEGILVSTTNSVVTKRSTATEVGVADLDTAINDVGVRALAGSGVVDVAGRAGGSVRDSTETPWGTRLGSQSTVSKLGLRLLVAEVHSVVRLNEGNL
jgi:hypothetical protein